MYIVKMITDYQDGTRGEAYLKSVGFFNTFTGRIKEAKKYKTKKDASADIKTVKGGKLQKNRAFEILLDREN